MESKHNFFVHMESNMVNNHIGSSSKNHMKEAQKNLHLDMG
jgi:hypothetical protein